ncbi:TIR domain-containing protein [Pimelobacter simplex]|nr:TIR domain-containing protein [Pimelobacter simplex]
MELTDELSRRTTMAGGTRAPIDITTDHSALVVDPKPSDPTTALVVIGGSKTATDEDVSQAAKACRASMRVCIPMFDPCADFASQVPDVVHELNGVPWADAQSPEVPASTVLRLLGLTETERKAFVSYRRTDGSALANQLRYSLVDAGWDVFLDRFSVPPAAVFQEQLDRDLADKAFVVLVESPDAVSSIWVEHEIAFAHMHKFGLMSLALPETTRAEYFPAVLEDLRKQLDLGDVDGPIGARKLTPDALESVLVEIDRRHASAFQQRREILLLDAAEELERAGFKVEVLGGWSLLASNAAGDEVVTVTPRAPAPRDLMAVEALRSQVRAPKRRARGWVVHPLEDIDRDRASLIAWMSRHRRVGPSPVMLLGTRVKR